MSKNTLIFGGTRGIGKVISEYLNEKQYNVITFSRQQINNSNHLIMNAVFFGNLFL